MDVDGDVVCRTKLLKRGLSFNRQSCVAASYLSQHPSPGPHCSFTHKHTQIDIHSAPVATPSSCSCFFLFFLSLIILVFSQLVFFLFCFRNILLLFVLFFTGYFFTINFDNTTRNPHFSSFVICMCKFATYSQQLYYFLFFALLKK